MVVFRVENGSHIFLRVWVHPQSHHVPSGRIGWGVDDLMYERLKAINSELVADNDLARKPIMKCRGVECPRSVQANCRTSFHDQRGLAYCAAPRNWSSRTESNEAAGPDGDGCH
jgi:hypothetical protein